MCPACLDRQLLSFGDHAEGAVAAGANLNGAGLGVHGDRLHSQGAQARVVEICPGSAAVGTVQEGSQTVAESQRFAGDINVIIFRTTDRDRTRIESTIVEGKNLRPVRPWSSEANSRTGSGFGVWGRAASGCLPPCRSVQWASGSASEIGKSAGLMSHFGPRERRPHALPDNPSSRAAVLPPAVSVRGYAINIAAGSLMPASSVASLAPFASASAQR